MVEQLVVEAVVDHMQREVNKSVEDLQKRIGRQEDEVPLFE
jgi:hypothetical protein